MKLTLRMDENDRPVCWQAQDGETYLEVTNEDGKALSVRLEGIPVEWHDITEKENGRVDRVDVRYEKEMQSVSQDFVTFYSLGHLFPHKVTMTIDCWNVDLALEMLPTLAEKQRARIYGFYFSTRRRGPEELDSSIVSESAIYYLNGTIRTLEELERRNDPSAAILRENMRRNGYTKIVESKIGGYQRTSFLEKDDVVLETPPVSEP